MGSVNHIRFRLLGALVAIASLSLLARLFFWQVLKANELSSEGRNQYQSGERLIAPRGSILARDRTWLAASEVVWLVFANKSEMKESPRTVANKLAPFFVDGEAQEPKEALLAEAMRIEGLLSAKDSVWIPIKHKVNEETKQNIAALRLDGIGFERQEGRTYPEASAAAHILGFVGKNNEGADVGYFGLEGFYDLSLSGKHGFIEREEDAKGIPILFGDSKEIRAVGGVNLITHIDKGVQILIEEKLKNGIERYGAKSGNVIILNPKDGSIIAMASFPSYDPASYFDFGNEFFKNPVISDAFEPGSIFKPLVMAAALDAAVIKPDTTCDICDGPVKVDKYEIETWDKKYHPDSTMTDVLVHSDNTGMVFIGRKLGKEKLYDYLDKYGFGKLSDIDLQGEASPSLREKDAWNIVDLATATFGQGIAVTPIQMIRATAAIANGGVLVNPHIVDAIEKAGVEEDLKVPAGVRILSQKATGEATQMMIAAVKNGEAKWTVPKGFKIAGKTGTAQIPVSGHYDDEKTIASFVGFAPADNAKFIMLVTLREPSTSQWGSETAAPLWFDIARDLFPYLGIQPEN